MKIVQDLKKNLHVETVVQLWFKKIANGVYAYIHVVEREGRKKAGLIFVQHALLKIIWNSRKRPHASV